MIPFYFLPIPWLFVIILYYVLKVPVLLNLSTDFVSMVNEMLPQEANHRNLWIMVPFPTALAMATGPSLRCRVPAGSETAGPSCVEHSGTLWLVPRAESEPRTAAASPWRRPRALSQSGTPGRTGWSSRSPWLHWTSPPLPRLSRIHGPVRSGRDGPQSFVIVIIFIGSRN